MIHIVRFNNKTPNFTTQDLPEAFQVAKDTIEKRLAACATIGTFKNGSFKGVALYYRDPKANNKVFLKYLPNF